MLVPVLLILGVVGIWFLPDAADRRAAGTLKSLFARPSLTHREQILHRRLAVMYPEHLIFTHIALAQLLDLMPRTSAWQSIRCRSAQLVADFVVCRRDLSIVAVIQLDAPTSQMMEVVESTGVRWVTIGSGPIPSQAELQAILREKRGLSLPIDHS
jgi:hypothetical protein